MTAAVSMTVPLAGVASWPAAGVTMLIILAVLLAIAVAVANTRPSSPTNRPAEDQLPAIGPARSTLETEIESDEELPVHDI